MAPAVGPTVCSVGGVDFISALMTITVRVIDAAKANLAGIQASLAAVGLEVVKTNAVVNGFSFDSLIAKVQSFSNTMSTVGRRLTTTVTLPILAAFALITDAAVKQAAASTQLELK